MGDNKYYTLKLTARGPIHIASGQKFMKKEYVMDLKNKKVLVMDFNKMYQAISKNRQEKDLQKYMMTNGRDSLGKWLSDYRYTMEEYKKWTKYELDCGDAIIEKGKTIEISPFIKDAYDLPYIPGSSLKGMLRTILLAYSIAKNPEQYSMDKRRIINDAALGGKRTSLLSGNIKNIESKYFNILDKKPEKITDAVNDFMSGIIVSDSEPLTCDDLVLCQKIDMHQNGEKKSLPILRECIKPGTEVTFHVTIAKDIPVDAELIMEAIKTFGNIYYDNYVSKFPNTAKQRENAVWLGGGCGFHTKTIINSLLENNYMDIVKTTDNIMKVTLGKNYTTHKHQNDVRNGMSPHILKVTKYCGKIYQMGMGLVEIIE